MNRRHFIVTCSMTPLILLPNSSNAFLPALLRFLLTGIVRGVARGVAATIVSGMASSMVSARSLGITQGSVMEVSPYLSKQIQDNRCNAIFIRNAENIVTVQGDTRFASNLTYTVEDIHTSSSEIERTIYASSSNSDFQFSFPISELPNTGVKRLIGTPEDPTYGQFFSPNFIIADAHDVSLYS